MNDLGGLKPLFKDRVIDRWVASPRNPAVGVNMHGKLALINIFMHDADQTLKSIKQRQRWHTCFDWFGANLSRASLDIMPSLLLSGHLSHLLLPSTLFTA